MQFSILIPVYNTKLYLKECVQSVLDQTFHDYEIILIDDGSTDGCSEMCDEYAKQYSQIKVIHKANEGLMMTRRRGFSEASGDYVLCLDSDDYYCEKNALENINKVIDKTGADLLLVDYIHQRNDSRNNEHIRLFEYSDEYVYIEKQEVINKLILGSYMNIFACKVISRHIIDTDVDYTQWKQFICRGEDYFQAFPIIYHAKKIVYMPKAYYYYRMTPGAISRKEKTSYYLAYKTIYQRENEYLDIWAIDNDTKYKVYVKQFHKLINLVAVTHTNAVSVSEKNNWRGFVCDVADDGYLRHLIHDKCVSGGSVYHYILYGFIETKTPLLMSFFIKIWRLSSKLKTFLFKSKQ